MVGVQERFEDSLKLLEKKLPTYFEGKIKKKIGKAKIGKEKKGMEAAGKKWPALKFA